MELTLFIIEYCGVVRSADAYQPECGPQRALFGPNFAYRVLYLMLSASFLAMADRRPRQAIMVPFLFVSFGAERFSLSGTRASHGWFRWRRWRWCSW